MLPAYRQLEKPMPAIYMDGEIVSVVCKTQAWEYIYSSQGFTGAFVMNVCNFWDLHHFLHVHPYNLCEDLLFIFLG